MGPPGKMGPIGEIGLPGWMVSNYIFNNMLYYDKLLNLCDDKLRSDVFSNRKEIKNLLKNSYNNYVFRIL